MKTNDTTEHSLKHKSKMVKDKSIVFNHSCSKDDIKSLYDPLVNFFMIFGIDIYECKGFLRKIRIIFKLIFYLLSLANLIVCPLLLGYFLDGFSQKTLSPVLLYYTDSIWRYLLTAKGKDFNRLIKAIINFDLSSEYKAKIKIVRKKIIFVAILSILLILYLLVYGVTNSLQHYKSMYADSPNILSTFKSVHPYALFTMVMTGTVLIFTYHMMPLAMYAIFLSTISWNITEILRDFDKKLPSQCLDMGKIHDEYSKISSLVSLADKTFSKLVFFSIVGIGTRLYFSLYFIMGIDVRSHGYGVLAILTLILILSLMFSAYYFAAQIPCLNQKILKTISGISLGNNESLKRLVVSTQVQQGLYLTIGGVSPIENGKLWALVGTIATYSILIKSFSLH